MQYGVKVDTYKKTQEKKDIIKIGDDLATAFVMAIIGALISRVIFYLNTENIVGIAPFGVALLLSVIIRRNKKIIISVGLGVFIGYMTVNYNINCRYTNMIIVILLTIYGLLIDKFNIKIKNSIFYLLIVCSYFVYGMVINKYDVGVSITIALVNTIVVIPIYYIIKYGITCIEEFNTNYFFRAEEIISIGMIVCLMVSGIGEFNIVNIQIRNVIAYIVILSVAYTAGAPYGTAIGVAMGLIVGINSGDMVGFITLYSTAGLISGIFKDTGRLFTFLSYIVMYFAIAIYSRDLTIAPLLEIIFSGCIFLCIPNSLFNILQSEFDIDKKKDQCNEKELSEVKEEFTDKIKNLQCVLMTISKTLHHIGNNNKLMYKNKSTALIENLADRVCPKCSKCDKCWSRDFNITYNAFERLIKSYENGKVIFPNELEKMCLYKFDLLKDTERIISTLNNKEVLKDRLEEGRHLLANHVDNISDAIEEMLIDFNKEIEISDDFERIVRRALNKNGIQYKKIFCYRDASSRIKIKLTMGGCLGNKYCGKNVLPILNDIMNKKMCISGDGCNINPKTKECTILFEESPKFKVVSYGASALKEGEQYSGDTFSFGKSNNNKYINIISDGMGYGPEAGKESKATVDIVEKFIEAGFTKEAAINMINSIMAMKFEEDEKFSTLDLNIIDLYSGVISFVKVGAVASFIKRGKKVKRIISNMPPFGVVDKVEIEEVREHVKSGDVVITLSDGIVDVNKEKIGEYNWIEEFLVSSSKEPKQLAEDILDKAKELSGGRIKDDMSVIVSKVYSL